MIRRKMEAALSDAKSRDDPVRTALLRLMLTALHDRAAGIAAEEGTQRLTDAEAMDLLRRMLRQRELSVARYEKAGRMELA